MKTGGRRPEARPGSAKQSGLREKHEAGTFPSHERLSGGAINKPVWFIKKTFKPQRPPASLKASREPFPQGTGA